MKDDLSSESLDELGWERLMYKIYNSQSFKTVGLSNKCARSLNERSGASVKTESATGHLTRPTGVWILACEAREPHAFLVPAI